MLLFTVCKAPINLWKMHKIFPLVRRLTANIMKVRLLKISRNLYMEVEVLKKWSRLRCFQSIRNALHVQDKTNTSWSFSNWHASNIKVKKCNFKILILTENSFLKYRIFCADWFWSQWRIRLMGKCIQYIISRLILSEIYCMKKYF